MSATILVGTAIGKGLLAGAIGDLYLFIKSSSYNEELEQVLQDLDIKAELDVVQALLEDVAHHTECRAVKVSSDQVKESVDKIHNELKDIQQEFEYHKTRYFSNWRTPSYKAFLRNLKKHRDVLRKRRELLISVLSIQGNLQNNIINKTLQSQSIKSPCPINPKKTFLNKWLD